jgi:hypothetical protein
MSSRAPQLPSLPTASSRRRRGIHNHLRETLNLHPLGRSSPQQAPVRSRNPRRRLPLPRHAAIRSLPQPAAARTSCRGIQLSRIEPKCRSLTCVPPARTRTPSQPARVNWRDRTRLPPRALAQIARHLPGAHYFDRAVAETALAVCLKPLRKRVSRAAARQFCFSGKSSRHIRGSLLRNTSR